MPEEASKGRSFDGQSEHGDLAEAIEDAVQQAMSELRTDFVRWELVHVKGGYGGFANRKDLTATILAASHPSEG